MIIRPYLKSLLASAALLLALGNAEARAQHDVTNVGPPGGDVRGLAVSVSGEHIVWAYEDMGMGGRLFRYDGTVGRSRFLVRENLGEVWVHPTSSDTLFAWSRRSTDGGASWSAMAAPVHNFVFDPAEPSTMWGVTLENELWVSHDAGDTWTPVSTKTPIRSLAVSPAEPDVLYSARATFQSAVLRSDDGGMIWTEIKPGFSASHIVPCPDNASTIYVAGHFSGHYETGVFRTDTGGEQWSLLLSVVEPVNSLALRAGDPARVYLLTREDLYFSSDGGITWEARGGGIQPRHWEHPLRVLELDPKHSSRMYAGTRYWGVFETEDDGLTWSWSNISPARVWDVTVHPGTSERLFATARRQGLLMSHDGGAAWEVPQFAEGPLPWAWPFQVAFSASDPNRGYLTSRLYGVYRTFDGGYTWERATPFFSIHDQGLGVSVHPEHPDTLVVSSRGNSAQGIFRSYDGGDSWHGIQPLGFWQTLDVAFDLTAPSSFYAFRPPLWGGQLLRSNDLGETWEAINGSLEVSSMHISMDGWVYVTQQATGGGSGGVFRSRTKHIEWEALPIAPFIEGEVVSGRAAVTDRHIPQIVYAAMEDGLYVSRDEGQTWSRLTETPWLRDEGTATPFMPPAMEPDPHVAGRLWFVDMEGITRLDYKPVGTDPAPNPPAALTLHPPFPNPAQSVVHLRLDAATGQRLVVEVFDLLGRRVATLFDEKVMTSGPIDLRWEASPSGLRLPSGTYVIRARSDEHTVEQMVTIVR